MSAFDYSGPSLIVSQDSSFLASRTTTKKRGGPESITGISRTNDERIAAQRAAILGETSKSPWKYMTVIGAAQGQVDRDRSAKLVGKRNDRRSQ